MEETLSLKTFKFYTFLELLVLMKTICFSFSTNKGTYKTMIVNDKQIERKVL